ncbi:Bug family tripartite tricarboxylate transporter substrate binding protein [Verticiella sediminum]|nr:tripartite tricarboxylate transporter substrate binding protein [Verticiella sediminum]
MRMLRTLCLGMAMATAVGTAPAQALEYPNRPIKLIVGWSPGGATDLLARTLATELNGLLQQPVVVENRPGANGTIGHAQAANAPADGYTLLLATNSTYAIAEHLYRGLSYRHQTDLAPVSLVASSPLMLAVRPDLPADDAAGLLALAKREPGLLNIASGGAGSTSHMAAELFMSVTGTRMTHVPYKGGGPATQAVAAGEVDVAFLDLGVAAPLAAAGRIRAIGVTGSEHSPLLPGVPPIASSGVPQFQSTTNLAVFVPAGTPQPVVARLAEAIRAALAAPALRDKLSRQGLVLIGSTPQALGQSVQAESAQWAEVIRERGIALEP